MPVSALALARALALAPAHAADGTPTPPAARIEQGILGQPWGPRKSFPAPGTNCRANTEPGTPWGGCQSKLGDLPLRTSWAYQHGIFYGVVMLGETYATCSDLYATLQAAWGPGEPTAGLPRDALPARIWLLGTNSTISAGFEQVIVPGFECRVVIVHLDWYNRIQAIEAERAEKRALGL